MKFGGIAVMVVAATLSRPSLAQTPVDPALLQACDSAQELAINLYRSGHRKEARRLAPTLEKCVAIRRAELTRQVDQLNDTMDQMIKAGQALPAR